MTERNSFTLFTAPLLALKRWLEGAGIGLESIPAHAEIDAAATSDEFNRLPREQWILLLDQAAERLRDPLIGLHLGEAEAGGDQTRPCLGVVQQTLYNNPALGPLLEQYQQLAALLDSSVALLLQPAGKNTRCCWLPHVDADYHAPSMEYWIAQTVSLCRALSQGSLPLQSVSLAHAALGPRWRYRRFFNCPVRFQARYSQIEFDSDLLQRPLIHSHPQLHGMLSAHCRGQLQTLQGSPRLSERLRAWIRSQLIRGQPDSHAAARHLAMTRQTLHRHLRQEGSSFKILLKEVRLQEACRYLQQEEHSLGEIAYLLGFSEQSAFSRAFKRYMGEAPASYRARSRADQNC